MVVMHWVKVMLEGAEEQGERGQDIRHQNSLFYVDNGMFTLSDSQWIQGAFSTLVGLFNRLGLLTNVGKTVSMVYRTFQAAGTQLEAAYWLKMTGEGLSYREQQKGRVKCREYGEEMVVGYLAGHSMTQHGRSAEERRICKTSATREYPRTYRMAFPAKGGPRSCPVEGFPGRAATRTVMRVNFLQLHVLDTVVILKEGNLSQPRCPRCDMLFPWITLNGSHPATTQCARGAER